MVMVVSLLGCNGWGVKNNELLRIVPEAVRQALALEASRRIKGAIAHMVAIRSPISML